MATAYGIAIAGQTPVLLAVEAKLEPGHSLLRIEGNFTPEVHNVVIASMQAIHVLSQHYPLRPERFDDHDLCVSLHSTYAIGGESYGLPLAMAILGEMVGKQPAREICFTGVILPSGSVVPVDDIVTKRKYARQLGFKKLVLPSPQLDLTSDVIDQVPIDSVLAVMGGAFWDERSPP